MGCSRARGSFDAIKKSSMYTLTIILRRGFGGWGCYDLYLMAEIRESLKWRQHSSLKVLEHLKICVGPIIIEGTWVLYIWLNKKDRWSTSSSLSQLETRGSFLNKTYNLTSPSTSPVPPRQPCVPSRRAVEQLTNDWSGRNWRGDSWRKTDEGRADEWLTWAHNWRTLTWAKLLCRNASIVVGKVRNPTKGLPDCLSPYRLCNNRQSRPLANRLILADSQWQLYKDRMFYCHLRWASRCGAFWAFLIPPWWPPSNNGRGMGLHFLCYASSACRFYWKVWWIW